MGKSHLHFTHMYNTEREKKHPGSIPRLQSLVASHRAFPQGNYSERISVHNITTKSQMDRQTDTQTDI